MPTVTLDFVPARAEQTLKEILDYMAASKKHCYLAIDEFQQITEYPEKGVEALLRSHINSCRMYTLSFPEVKSM